MASAALSECFPPKGEPITEWPIRRRHLILKWTGLVLFVAKRLMLQKPIVRRLGMDDAVGAGQFGLFEAARLYNEGIAKFNTYAYWAIRQHILFSAFRHACATNLPAWLFEGKERAKQMEEQVERFLGSMQLLADYDVPARERQSVWELDDIDQLYKTVSRLPPKERQVIRRHFGLGCEPETLEKIGQRMGRTKERIRQLEVAALRRLRQAFNVEVPA